MLAGRRGLQPGRVAVLLGGDLRVTALNSGNAVGGLLPLPTMWNRWWNAVWRASEPGCKPIGKLSGDGRHGPATFAFLCEISGTRGSGLPSGPHGTVPLRALRIAAERTRGLRLLRC